jgi:transcriptional regulator with XRE-family HTH domain
VSRLRSARTRVLIEADRRAASQTRAIGEELRRLREDAGLRQAEVARFSGISSAHLCEIESGRAEGSRRALTRVAAVLGADLSERVFPHSGPTIRDRHQARMLEALLGILHPRWTRHLEVPVYRPVRGVIDLVLEASLLLIATEVESGIRRLEQQLRWAHQKVDGLPATDLAAGRDGLVVSRLLILRSTTANRELVQAHGEQLRTEFPASARAAIGALTSGTDPWPGPTLLWARVDGTGAAILDRPARGVLVGR